MLDEYYYEHPNEVKDNYSDINIEDIELPKFMKVILGDVSISYTGTEDFINKFAVYYLTDSKFRYATDGCIFLFVAREYYGLYKNRIEALNVAHSTGCKGHEISLVPMYFSPIKEYLESTTCINSNLVRTTADTGKVFETILYDYINVKGCIISSEMNDNLEDLISSKYIIDTWAKITHLPNLDYFDYETNKYSVYPFDEDNNLLTNYEKKDNFKIAGDFILHSKIIEMRGSLNNSYFKRELFFDEGWEFRVNNSARAILKSAIAPHVEIHRKEKSNLRKFLLSSNNINFKRPNIPNYLLGLDILTQFKLIIEPVKNNTSSVTIIDNREKIQYITINNTNNYVVYQFKCGMELFENQIKTRITRNGSFTDTYEERHQTDTFFIIKEVFGIIDETNSNYHRTYINKRPLNLIILEKIINKKQLKEKIINNENIDGLLTFNNTNNEIWLKNPNILSYKNTLSNFNYNINENEYYNYYIQNENLKIVQYKLSEWTILLD